MSVSVRKISDSTLFNFNCAQWSLMSPANQAEWEVLENTCGLVTLLFNPYAASEFFYTLDGRVAAEDPLQIVTLAGISTINFKDQAAATVLAGPVSGADAYPTFRALELSDLPAGITGFYQALKDNNAAETQRAAANFLNSGLIAFTLTDDAANDETEVTADIIANSIGNTHFRQSAGLSVVGRGVNSTGDVTDLIAGTDAFVLRRSGTTLGFGQVATGGIADDAVTYAKIQNVVNNNRVLGRVSGANGVVEELTAAQLQTLLGFIDGSLTTPRIPYASDANTLTDSGSLRWLNGTLEVIVGDGTTKDARFTHAQAGNIAGGSKAFWGENNVSGDYRIGLVNTRNISNTGNAYLQIQVGGASAGDPFIYLGALSAGNWVLGMDNSDADKLKIKPNANTPGNVANSGITMTSEVVTKTGINKDAPEHPLDVDGRARASQIIDIAANPTAGALQAGMGTGGAVNFLLGTNNGFLLTFTVGTAPTVDSNLFEITLQTAFPGSFYPVFCQNNKNAARDINKFYYSAIDGAKFTLAVDGTLTASTQYSLFFCFFGR